MEYSIIFSGFGGQGILFAATLLAKCAMFENKAVSWLPSYGAEMRGGTANCTVVISDREIASPYQKNPNYVIAFNEQSFNKFEKFIKPSGMMLFNSSSKNILQKRSDIKYSFIDANHLANVIGEIKCLNIIMLADFINKTDIVKIDTLKQIISSVEGLSAQKFIDINIKAIDLINKYALTC